MSNLSTRLSDYIHDHSDKVALTLGLVVLALAVINFLWARRVKLLLVELALARRVADELTAAAKTRARIDSEAPVGLGRAVERDGRVVYTISQTPEQDAVGAALGGADDDSPDDGFVVRDPAATAPTRPVAAPPSAPTSGDAASWALSQQAAAEAASGPAPVPSTAEVPAWSISDAEPVADPSAAGWSATEQAEPTPSAPAWGIRQPGESVTPPSPAEAAPAAQDHSEPVDSPAAYDDAWALRSAVRSQHDLEAAAASAPAAPADDDTDDDDEGSWGLSALPAEPPPYGAAIETIDAAQTASNAEPVDDAGHDEHTDEPASLGAELGPPSAPDPPVPTSPAPMSPASSEGWGRPAFAPASPFELEAPPTAPAPSTSSEPATSERRHSRLAQLSWRGLPADETAERSEVDAPAAQHDVAIEPTPVDTADDTALAAEAAEVAPVAAAPAPPPHDWSALSPGVRGEGPAAAEASAGGDEAYAAWDTATAAPADEHSTAPPSDPGAYAAWDAVMATPEPAIAEPASTEEPEASATEPPEQDVTEPPDAIASAPVAAAAETRSVEAPMRVVDWQLVDPTPSRGSVTEPPAVTARPSDILLVEDDENVGRVYRLLMESRGLGVRQAADGIEGLEQVRARRPDLVLLDVMMPRMNGILFLETLRDDPELRDLPVVVLSNFREQRLVDRAMGLGALEYMVKAQTRPEALLSAIPHWLRGERVARV